MAFGGALPETIPVISANSVSRNYLCTGQRSRSRCGFALLVFFLVSRSRRIFTRQETHQCYAHPSSGRVARPASREAIDRDPYNRY